MKRFLGIESSCDETAAAVLTVTTEQQKEVFNVASNVIYSQTKEHILYGGVVPEIASRAHMEKISSIITKALLDAGTSLEEIDGIAVSSGPGLMGGLTVGLMHAKSLAQALNKPFIGVNHLEGHALTAHLTENVSFPYLLLLVSGGHCQFIYVESLGKYETLGGTIDDAVGECFDKVAKMLGFPYPGGPFIERSAKEGDDKAYDFPLPLQHKGLDFSFSGLKSAVRREIEKELHAVGEEELSSTSILKLESATIANISASFQRAVGEILAIKCERALQTCGAKDLVLAGGVAANTLLRSRLEALCSKKGVLFHAPPLNLCTDNAVMIAYAGALRLLEGEASFLNLSAVPRWPLDDLKTPNHI